MREQQASYRCAEVHCRLGGPDAVPTTSTTAAEPLAETSGAVLLLAKVYMAMSWAWQKQSFAGSLFAEREIETARALNCAVGGFAYKRFSKSAKAQILEVHEFFNAVC